jgi:hypothetical protein
MHFKRMNSSLKNVRHFRCKQLIVSSKSIGASISNFKKRLKIMFICSSYIITKMVKNIEKTPHTLSKFKIYIFCT